MKILWTIKSRILNIETMTKTINVKASNGRMKTENYIMTAVKPYLQKRAVLGDGTDFYQPALRSPPHASLSVSVALSCADNVKRHSEIQQ